MSKGNKEGVRDICNKVAVYGTLKKGFSAHGKMKVNGCRPVGRGLTQRLFGMLSMGFPMVIDEPEFANDDGFGLPPDDDKIGMVNVEVYENPNFLELDAYEAEGHLYKRRVETIEMEDGSIIAAWMYIGIPVGGNENVARILADEYGVLHWD